MDKLFRCEGAAEMRALRRGEAERGKGEERRFILDANGGRGEAARGCERDAFADEAEAGALQAARELDDRGAADLYNFII